MTASAIPKTVWVLGVVILLVLMGEAFFGYVLPYGQMSFWGAQVITSLFGSVPFIGPELLELIRGDYVIGDATLNRFNRSGDDTLMVSADYLEVVMSKKR